MDLDTIKKSDVRRQQSKSLFYEIIDGFERFSVFRLF